MLVVDLVFVDFEGVMLAPIQGQVRDTLTWVRCKFWTAQ